MKRLAGALVAILAVVGMKFYNKASAHDNVQTELIQLCEGDDACQTAVRSHYEGCFDASYKTGGRRQSSQLDADALVKCINSRAGEQYFSVSAEKK
jgi:hypothetical protein